MAKILREVKFKQKPYVKHNIHWEMKHMQKFHIGPFTKNLFIRAMVNSHIYSIGCLLEVVVVIHVWNWMLLHYPTTIKPLFAFKVTATIGRKIKFISLIKADLEMYCSSFWEIVTVLRYKFSIKTASHGLGKQRTW